MSESTTAESAQQVSPGSSDEALGEAGLKALQAEREARKQADKEKADLQAQLDAINAEKLSDLEKAQHAQQQAEKDAAEARREALRYRLAAKHGISETDAALFLTADSDESMEAQAKALAERTSGPKTPLPDLTQGGNEPAGTTTAEQFTQFLQSKLK